jgi:hypothetical protein
MPAGPLAIVASAAKSHAARKKRRCARRSPQLA